MFAYGRCKFSPIAALNELHPHNNPRKYVQAILTQLVLNKTQILTIIKHFIYIIRPFLALYLWYQ